MKIVSGYRFSDLLMVPIRGDITSRDTPDISVTCGKKYSLPFMASPMRGIVGPRLIKKLSFLGGIGFLHKFWLEKSSFIAAVEELTGYTYGIAVGLDLSNLEYATDAAMILVDVANGYSTNVLNAVETVKNKYPNKIVVAGNVVTPEGAKALTSAGADLVRVGIGNGGLCSTRAVTGIGYPQLSAIANCSEVANIIADGGMTGSGAMAKALAAGAKFCMLGSPLAKAYESSNSGIIYGMASAELHKQVHKEAKSIEGIAIEAHRSADLESIIERFAYGIKSSMTYLNARTLDELKTNVTWVEIAP